MFVLSVLEARNTKTDSLCVQTHLAIKLLILILILISYMDLIFATSEFILQMPFHPLLFALTLFCTSQKPPQAGIKNFFATYRIFFSFQILPFPSLISDVMLQNAHKNKVMETYCGQ